MGRASRFDVSGEVEASFAAEPSFFTPSAAVLLPFLLITQLTQLLVGLRTLQLIRASVEPLTWHPILVCAMCCIIGSGNLFTTLKTYYDKYFARQSLGSYVKNKDN
jgi:hypothetical protein